MKIVQWFIKAFENYRIVCNRTGSSFIFGSRDVDNGLESVRNDMLRIRSCGTARMKVVSQKCPNVLKEFKKYKKRVSPKEGVKEKPIDRFNHLMDCLRYLSMFRPEYVEPKPFQKRAVSAYIRNKEKRNSLDSILMGPATGKTKHDWM